MFKQWTTPRILDYLDFAKTYVAQWRAPWRLAVEQTLTRPCADVARDRPLSGPKKKIDLRAEEKRRDNAAHEESEIFTDGGGVPPVLPRATRPRASNAAAGCSGAAAGKLLYFLEKSAPRLQPWQRGIDARRAAIAIFYPQSQTR